MNKRIRKKKRKQLDDLLKAVDINKLTKAEFDGEQRILLEFEKNFKIINKKKPMIVGLVIAKIYHHH